MTTIVQTRSQLATLLASPRVRSLLLAALVMLYTGWIGYQWLRDFLIDFNVYYISAYGFVHGVDVYGIGYQHATTNRQHWIDLAAAAQVEDFTSPYRYPPLTAQLVVPLLQFSERVGGMIWIALTSVGFILTAWWLGRLWKQPEGASIVYLLLLGFVPALTTIHAGQVNGFVLLALTAALVGLAYRNAVLAGFALAVAALLKLVPFALCLYLGWRKQWLAAMACAVSLIGLMLTAPLMFGPSILGNYANYFFDVGEPGTLFITPTNQALSGFLARSLTPLLDSATIYQIYMVCAVLLLVATIALCWPLRHLPHFWPLEYALILCTLLVVPPFTWYHMLVLLFIPLVVVVERLWRNQQWKRLALVLVLYVATDVHGLLYHRFEELRWLTSFPFLLVMLLWGLLAWAILVERKATANAIGDALGVERKEQGLLASVSSHHA